MPLDIEEGVVGCEQSEDSASPDASNLEVCVTVDMEPDCPPYLWTWRGIDEGAPLLLDLFDRERISVTCFTTGDTARYAPTAIEQIVSASHELACHGMTHRRFQGMNRETAEWEIAESARLLRAFAEVTSFRAPYLDFPETFLDLLVDAGFTLDSSLAKYKGSYLSADTSSPLFRVPASITSSALRLPPWIRDRWLWTLRSPVVLFVHPWEFVDLTKEQLRFDCRFRTGPPALESLQSAIRHFKVRGSRFLTMRQLQA
jgi:peptidoglycan/xylan/chitin deacetylase (PgdA/CDA1 family)